MDRPILGVTGRCLLVDLGFSEGDLSVPLDDLARRSTIVKAFVERRSQQPEGQETIQGLTSRIVAYSLHSGRDRGITWHDTNAGVVWLLAARLHRSGEADDAYPYFLQLDRAGNLLPKREDYRAFALLQAQTFARSLLDEVPPLAQAARESPGEIHEGLLAGRIRVRVVHEDGDPPMTTVAISQRLLPGDVQVPPDWQLRIAAAFLPHTTPPENLSLTGDLAGEALREDEVAYCDFVDY